MIRRILTTSLMLTIIMVPSALAQGAIACWGNYSAGQNNIPSPNEGFTAVAAGYDHCLALKVDGSIEAWGYNSLGQCNVPAPNEDFVAIAGGHDHSLGLKTNGSIVAWGRNDYGQCDVPAPNTGFMAVAADGYHSLGLRTDGSIVAWGNNVQGQCDVPAPNTGFTAIAAGEIHNLGLKADSSIVAWGNNSFGQLDIPSPNGGFVAVGAGDVHCLALRADGSITAWGGNSYGQCNVPAPNAGFVDLAAGYQHSLGLRTGGSIVAWGRSDYGQCVVPAPNEGFVAVTGGLHYSASIRGEVAAAVTFTDIGAGLTGVRIVGATAWGDYDNDGDLDLVLAGDTDGIVNITRVYRNDGAGAFVDIGAGLPGVRASGVAWGDYDNDGDLDLALAGDTGLEPIARVYRNDGGAFGDIGAGLQGLSGRPSWGDYDNDGDLDLALSGDTGAGYIAQVYRNDAGSFADIAAGLPGAAAGCTAWGDFDNDGDLDLALTGDTGAGFIARVYRNDTGSFTDIGAGLPGSFRGHATWGDYDNDGDLDLALTGHTGAGYGAGVFRNDAGSFADIGAGLPGVFRGRVAWGDCDNDGDLDLALTGESATGLIARVYRNDAGAFFDIAAGLPGVAASFVSWGDYDDDGDLDLALTGNDGSEAIARIYRNDGAPANAPPAAPGGLSASVSGNQATLSWNAASDAETAPAGLSYNLRIGTTPGGNEIGAAMSDGATGYRRVPALGNAQQRLSWTVRVPAGNVHWSVQAVDGAWAGSPFAAEQSFYVPGFTDIGAGLPGVRVTATDWGDYDNDGDLDLLLMGDTGAETVARVYRNDAGAFFDIVAGLPGVVNRGPMAWGDYDNDGDLDLVLGGGGMSGYVASVYRNDAGAFVDVVAGLPLIMLGSAAWGDYDNDGDLDLALTGDTGAGYIGRVYRNTAGAFTDVGAGLPGVRYGTLAWGDYDNDGDLDLLLTGDTGAGNIARVYRNDAGAFAGLDVGLPGLLSSSAAAWGDYDNDGDLDLVLAGSASGGAISAVYRNDGGTFADVGAGLPGVSRRPAAAWGDYDNDGDPDLVLVGDTGAGFISRVYRNDAGTFADAGAGLPGVELGATSWGDYDNDGDLDLILTGDTGAGYIARIYRNESLSANTPPSAPGGLAVSASGDWVTFAWSPAADAQTPWPGLSYNMRVGATPGGDGICSGMAASSGYRRVPQLGNVNQVFARAFPAAAFRTAGSTYWSVQAVDGAWAGSAFALEQTFTLGPRILGVTDVPADQGGKVRLNVAAAPYDMPGDPLRPVSTYNVWQRIDDPALAATVAAAGRPLETDASLSSARTGRASEESPVLPADLPLTEWGGRHFVRGGASAGPATAASDAGTGPETASVPGFPPGTWELVGSFAAAQFSDYIYRATTVVDSPAVSVYLVSAHTTLPSLWFLSDPDSGRSVDNIAPGVPQGFAGTYERGTGVVLEWLACEAEDFQYFRVYRGDAPDFDITPENLVQATAGLGWTDPEPFEWPAYYKLTAVDHAGNESPPAALTHILDASGDRMLPATFALHAISPNPFARTAAIAFDLAEAREVRIAIYDIQGRQVRELVGDRLPAGRHATRWDGTDRLGRMMPAGAYLCRMEAGPFRAVRRLVMIP